jgi:AcrR family transcriptional regulator
VSENPQQTARERPQQPPRERLLATATELFYREGVHVVGIDRLLEQAGVAKWTLYHHFGNKDGLVRAYLEQHLAARHAHIAKLLARYETPREQLLAMFDDAARAVSDPRFTGCPFLGATAEAGPEESANAVTDAYRTWLRGVLAELATAAGAADPEGLAVQLHLLYDGAAIAARHDPQRAPAANAARNAATALITAAIPE